MLQLGTPVLILFVVSALLGFGLRFIRDRVYATLKVENFLGNLFSFSTILLPFAGLFVVATLFKIPAAATWPYFIGSALLAFLLAAVSMPPYLRGILVLAISVVLTIFAPAKDGIYVLTSFMVGLIAYKLADNLYFARQADLDDLLAPLVWLGGTAWIISCESGKSAALHSEILLGLISISILMRFFHGPFMRDDRMYLKRVVLGTAAGLGVLVMMNKVVGALGEPNLAFLCGAGYFVSYLLRDLDIEERYCLDAMKAIKALVLIGILTMVGGRFFGTFGLLALAATAIVAPVPGVCIFGGFFWLARVLLQLFIQNFSLNITGINVVHAYVGAGLYAGFLLACLLVLLIKDIKEKRALAGMVVGLSLLAPLLSNFVLHAEPTSSLLLSATTACIMLAVLVPSLRGQALPGCENLAVVPALLSIAAILGNGLIEMGNTASVGVRTSVLGYAVIFVFVSIVLYWFVFQRKNVQGSDKNGVQSPS